MREYAKRLSWVFILALTIGVAGAWSAEDALPCTNYIMMVADTGLVVDEYNADEPHAPASMVKLMLMLLVTEGLESNKWTLETPIKISTDAANVGGTQVELRPNETWSLDQLMTAVAVASANNAATAVAEGLWGSIDKYLEAANARAKELGMNSTEYHSVHGLPPDKGQLSDLTTARDMAHLAEACITKAQIMTWVGVKEFSLRPEEAPKPNTNKLLFSLEGCDGLKTGYTRAAGFCLTATAVRNGVRLITVVMGCPVLSQRFEVARVLLDQGFSTVRRERIIAKGDLIEPAVPVGNAKIDSLQLAAGEDVWVIAKETDLKQVKLVAEHPERLVAPLDAGAVAGTVKVELAGKPIGESPLLVPSTVEEPGWRWKLTHSVLGRSRQTQQQGG
ncbi:MAG: D-alanyl-D-alanine carboxypeptidase [Candidatus Hydrogenedentes bacterium]|nr:D-alanyl-D-alanine carboxypeptidase [Candidatus Hydrogenedentota bacterium]